MARTCYYQPRYCVCHEPAVRLDDEDYQQQFSPCKTGQLQLAALCSTTINSHHTSSVVRQLHLHSSNPAMAICSSSNIRSARMPLGLTFPFSYCFMTTAYNAALLQATNSNENQQTCLLTLFHWSTKHWECTI